MTHACHHEFVSLSYTRFTFVSSDGPLFAAKPGPWVHFRFAKTGPGVQFLVATSGPGRSTFCKDGPVFAAESGPWVHFQFAKTGPGVQFYSGPIFG